MTENFLDGCILLSRSLMDSNVFQNEKWLKVWIWCLLKANHKKNMVPIVTGKGQTVVEVNRGQFIFGRLKAGKELKMNPETVRSIMNKLEKLENITMQSYSHYTIVSICNYNIYQDIEKYKNQKKHQANTKQTPSKHQANTTNNNEKNENKKNIYIEFPKLNLEAWQRWLAYKKEIKSKYKTENGEKSKITELINISNGDLDLQSKIIKQSIDNEWKGLFPLKTNTPNYEPKDYEIIIDGESQLATESEFNQWKVEHGR